MKAEQNLEGGRMTFYGIDYLQAQSTLNDYLKYFFIFGSLVVLIVVFSLYLRHRIQTKYRDLSIIVFLFLIFLSGVQYSDYNQNKNKHSQSSQMVAFVEQLAQQKNVSPEEILVNSVQLTDGVIIKIEDTYYKVTLSADQRSFTLQEAYLTTTDIQIIDGKEQE